jgi:hypothetical protein
MQINPMRVGAIFGLLIGLGHACWAGLVVSGLAQKLIDFIFWLHFLAPSFQVQPFDLTLAVILVGVTFLVGLAVGEIFWNMLARAEGSQ